MSARRAAARTAGSQPWSLPAPPRIGSAAPKPRSTCSVPLNRSSRSPLPWANALQSPSSSSALRASFSTSASSSAAATPTEDEPKKAKKVAKPRKPKASSTAVPDASSAVDEPVPVAVAKTPPKLLLAQSFKLDGSGADPTGYWMSEKLDGIRGYWDGSTFVSRLGTVFWAPTWFTDLLPKDLDLDGELYLRRNGFAETSSIVRSHASGRWNELVFKVFDIPSSPLPFEERLAVLHERFGAPSGTLLDGGENPYCGKPEGRRYSVIEVLGHVKCTSREHLTEVLEGIQKLDGEGMMLRKPGSLYKRTRSTDLLKVKTFFDGEAIVIGYRAGKGKYEGMTGSLECKMACGRIFRCGSGLTDLERHNPPPIGSLITYRFFEVSKKEGIPRFPTFVGIAVDKSEPKDAEVPESRMVVAGSTAKDVDL